MGGRSIGLHRQPEEHEKQEREQHRLLLPREPFHGRNVGGKTGGDNTELSTGGALPVEVHGIRIAHAVPAEDVQRRADGQVHAPVAHTRDGFEIA